MTTPYVRALIARPPQAIVIGASAGAVDALKQLLPAIPREIPAPILIVVHVPPDRRSGLPALFAAGSTLAMTEAEDKAVPLAGHVYFAPPDYHLLLEHDGTLALSVDEPIHYSRPSIDVLFDSAADACGARVLGILLSGASADGAEGLARIRADGGHAWVQSPESAQVPAMPRAALQLAPHVTMHPGQMGSTIAAWVNNRA